MQDGKKRKIIRGLATGTGALASGYAGYKLGDKAAKKGKDSRFRKAIYGK